MAPLCSIRSAFLPPAHPDGGLCTAARDEDAETIIEFRHPGYPDHNNIMLVFPILDPFPPTNENENENENGVEATTFGLHYETARLACAIVANNKTGWIPF
ncbi:hypothetical protein B0T25DRAFT_519017 [Lasiosphaeria hispida]|uniref:Uncharacterized protein n=1 Tax=Lasiosphaeria hispida TaxID=260671 RepID=A0AAJ0HD09_9PEZI|nr:hypothetical protein B0T25DRAFT_519017 [Lasiosphaeria hispida]